MDIYKNLSLDNMPDEIWVDVQDFPRYQISNMGRICRIERMEQSSYFWDRANHNRHIKRKILKQTLNKGYLKCSLYSETGATKKTLLIHRLVAINFIPNPENKPDVNHTKGITTDNRAESLEWATRPENMQHAHKTGLKHNLNGESHPRTKLKIDDVVIIRKMYQDGHTIRDIGNKFNLIYSTTWSIVNNRSFKHIS